MPLCLFQASSFTLISCSILFLLWSFTLNLRLKDWFQWDSVLLWLKEILDTILLSTSLSRDLSFCVICFFCFRWDMLFIIEELFYTSLMLSNDLLFSIYVFWNSLANLVLLIFPMTSSLPQIKFFWTTGFSLLLQRMTLPSLYYWKIYGKEFSDCRLGPFWSFVSFCNELLVLVICLLLMSFLIKMFISCLALFWLINCSLFLLCSTLSQERSSFKLLSIFFLVSKLSHLPCWMFFIVR